MILDEANLRAAINDDSSDDVGLPNTQHAAKNAADC